MSTTEKSQQQQQSLTLASSASHGFGLSPPSMQYTHIDHALVPPTSQEPYSQIGHNRAATLPATLSPGYDKLNHHHLYNHSAGTFSTTNPISIQPFQQQPQTQMVSTLPFRRSCTCQQTGSLHGMQNVSGQAACLSTAPCQSHVSLTSSLPHTLSHSTVAAHLPPGVFQHHHHPPGGHLDPRGVHQNPPGGMHHNPPLNMTAKSRSGELSCPDFHRYWEGEGGSPRSNMRTRSITSSTLC